jgi:hypothetical protein
MMLVTVTSVYAANVPLDKYSGYKFKANTLTKNQEASIERDIKAQSVSNLALTEFKNTDFSPLKWDDVVIYAAAMISESAYVALARIQAFGPNRGEVGGTENLLVFKKDGETIQKIYEYGYSDSYVIEGKSYSLQNVDGDRYGCIYYDPVSTSDLNLDGYADVFVLNGGGQQNSLSITDRLEFSIYDGLTNELRLKEELMYTNLNLLEIDPANEYLRYEVKLRSKGRKVIPAESRYAKFFFNDFDKDDLNNLIVWRKTFVSRKTKDGMGKNFGYEDAVNSFILYEESPKNGKWRKQVINEKQALNMLSNFDMDWDDGYPNKSLCNGEEGKKIKIKLNYPFE